MVELSEPLVIMAVFIESICHFLLIVTVINKRKGSRWQKEVLGRVEDEQKKTTQKRGSYSGLSVTS